MLFMLSCVVAFVNAELWMQIYPETVLFNRSRVNKSPFILDVSGSQPGSQNYAPVSVSRASPRQWLP